MLDWSGWSQANHVLPCHVLPCVASKTGILRRNVGKTMERETEEAHWFTRRQVQSTPCEVRQLPLEQLEFCFISVARNPHPT